eukprot:8798086-Lingulodinium_polyedra.AAC.1
MSPNPPHPRPPRPAGARRRVPRSAQGGARGVVLATGAQVAQPGPEVPGALRLLPRPLPRRARRATPG